MRRWSPLALGVALAAQDPTARLEGLLGTPYRVDGAQDDQGRYVTFTAPASVQATPGLNCSGFVLAAARRVLGFSGDPGVAGRDRLGDSGPGAPGGADWDFGWDLVLNLSEGRDRRWLTPTGGLAVAADARTVRGFGMHDGAAWGALLPKLSEERVYLVVLNRSRGGRVQHHHVAVILRQRAHVWFHQALPGGRAHRLDLATPGGMGRLRAMFGPGERVRILEVTPPHP